MTGGGTGWMTIVEALVWSLAGLVSVAVVVIDAEASSVEPEGAVTLTVMVTVAVVAPASDPSSARIVPVPPTAGDVTVPWLVWAETKVVPAGVAIVKVTLPAESTPLFAIVAV